MHIVVKPSVNYGIAFAELNRIMDLMQTANGMPIFTYQLDPYKRSIDIQCHDDTHVMNSATMSEFAVWMSVFSN